MKQPHTSIPSPTSPWARCHPSVPLSPTHQVMVLHGRCIVVEEGERVAGLDQVIVL